MTAAFRSVGAVASGALTTVTCTPPAGIADGDILIAHLYAEGVLGADMATVSSGFLKIVQWSSTNFLEALYWKRAASEAGNYTFGDTLYTFTSGCVGAFSGAIASGSPIDVSGTGSIGSSTTGTAAAVTTLTADTLLCYFASNFDAVSYTPPSGMTERYDASSFELATVPQAGTGSTGTKAATLASSSEWAAVLVALLPAAGGGGGNVSVPWQKQGQMGAILCH